MSTIEQESFATLAAASEGAYSGLDINGFTVVEKLEDPNTGFSLVIYKNPAAEEYIFAFRGTELSSQDIYTDLNVGMKQWSPDIREQVETRIYAYTAKKSDAIIHFTGHSLGGALAQYAAYEYAISASNAASGGDLQATFDLVTFNALGGVLALSDPLLYPNGYDPSVAAAISAAHFKINTDVVSRLGDDHIGGELLVIDRPSGSPLRAHAIANFTGENGGTAVTTGEYQDAVVEDNYLEITQLLAVSGIVANFGDDGQFTPEEALLRTIAAFSFGLANGDSGDLSQLVTAFFGDASTIGQTEFDAWILLGEQAISALQYARLTRLGNVVGAYALTFANVLQWSAQLWEEHPGVADAVGLAIDTYIESVIKPGMVVAGSALEFALENEFLADEFRDSVDFIENTRLWVDKYFAAHSVHEMYIEGTAGDDVLSGEDAYWAGKSPDDHIFGYAGNDSLEGGIGTDFLVGGSGADRFYWNTGDGTDYIGDYDDAGDRIYVNGIDLATLEFQRTSAGAPYYADSSHPDITLHYDGDFLTINVGSGPGAGSITVTRYTPAAGEDYGILLNDYSVAAPITDITVSRLGDSDAGADDETGWNAWDRQRGSQRGLDWSAISLGFDGDAVINYVGGSLHGTSGGVFEGGPANDYLLGEAGSNALHGLAGDDLIDGAGGDDFLEGGAGSDVISGGDGSDLVFGSSRAGLAAQLEPGTGPGQFYLPQIADMPGDENTLSGGPGDDFVSGGEHSDHMDGGVGADYLLGGTGADYISGGADRDVIYGDSALNYRYVEQVPGVAGELLEIAFADGIDDAWQYDDVIHAGAGDDTVWGELGDDTIYGEAGDDNLVGDRYDDPAYFAAELPAYAGTSPALGATLHGNDRLFGGAGNDLLLGLGGDDLLAGGAGADSLAGGAGSDTYVFAAGDGLDHILDTEGTHTLLFTGIALADLQVIFRGDQVFVGTGYGAEGFYFNRSEWANVRIAQDTPGALLERSMIETLYFDAGGDLLLTVKGTNAMTEAARDALFTVDDSNPERPGVAIGAGVDNLSIEASADGSDGATMRVVSGGLEMILELTALQLATGLDFLSLADGVPLSLAGLPGYLVGSAGADRIVGSESADSIQGGGGNDVLEGRGGDDDLDGGTGNDVLRGGGGNDTLFGGQSNGRDWLDGGPGSDTLDGGYGPDTYAFGPGDGQDRVSDPEGYNYLEFEAAVDPNSVALYYTGTTASRFRVEYGQGDAFSSAGSFSSYWINGITVGGTAIPLVQRSDLVDGIFRDTRWHDVFEPGAGSDTIHVNGWGNDAFRFAAGDGQDVILVDNNFYPELMGEIRLAADVDLDALSFSFTNADAIIAYGPGDQLTLDTDTVYSVRDNTLGRFTLVSEANPAWIPVIRAQGYVGNVHGSFGADHIIGGPNIETILPGCGDDIIEAAGGPDRIVLNDVYMGQGTHGIGHKEIWGQGDDDIIETPLYQGLTFHYNRGDGNDRIEYDWSYSWQHPYRFIQDTETYALTFQPYGEDTLAFGPGIALTDLRFIRSGETLTVALRDGEGSVTIQDFFPAWDVVAAPGGGDSIPPIPEEGAGPDSLLDHAFLPLLPRTPIAALVFADGSRYEMAAVLDSFLEVSEATLLGSEGDDELYGTGEDDIIHALGGNDYIEDLGGSNVILAGAGDDQVVVGGDSVIDPGAGNDWVYMVAGSHVLSFGPGSGSDLVMLDTAMATVVVELSAGLTDRDISIALAEMEWGQVPMIVLPGTGDALVLASLLYDPELDEWSADPDSAAATLRFADGSVITGGELYALAGDGGGETFAGTGENDVLIGTQGDDIMIGGRGDDVMDGAAGDDLFLVEGRRQGKDRIIGGTGFDTISGGDGDDRITLTELLALDSIERIDGGPGTNTVAGTGGANILDFSGTELLNIAAIDGRGGRDQITGSAGDDIIIGGAGRDTLSGGAGNDTYVFGAGDGRDVIFNADADPASLDILQLTDADYDQVWLSRRRSHLVINIAGSSDRVLIKNWYANPESELDAIYAGGRVLMRDQVDQLVNAMAAFDVPEGVDAFISGQTALQLEPVLTAVWQAAA